MLTMKTYIVIAAVITTLSCSIIPEDQINVDGYSQNAPKRFKRMVYGIEAIFGSIPYTIGISYRKNAQDNWCGGALISPQWVLTAGSCMYLSYDVVVFVGTNKRNDFHPWSYSFKINMHNGSVHVHEYYNDKEKTNDIALIKLPYQVNYSLNIKAVDLPRKTTVFPLLHNIRSVFSGWGKTTNNFEYKNPLSFIELYTMKNSNCADLAYYPPGMVKPTNICLNSTGGISAGDIGGPLVHKEKNYLIGLCSFGNHTSVENGYPIVFTRIHPYLDWIQQKNCY